MIMNMDMDLLRNALPSGLTVWKIANEVVECQQRVHYEIVTPTFATTGNTSVEPAVPDEDVDVVVTTMKKGQGKNERIPTVLQQLAGHIDEMYHVLPGSMKKETEKYLKTALLEFVMSSSGNHVLGPKKCRECVAYLQTPMLGKCDAFFQYCSFLLDAKIVVDHQVHTWNHQPYETEIVLLCKN